MLHTPPHKGTDVPVGPAGTFPFGTRLCAPVAGIQHVPHVSLIDRHTHRVTARVGSDTNCNVPATLIGYLPNHGRCAWDPDCPHIPTLVFSAHFVLTRVHPGSTSRSVTHPKTTPGQARLTWEFFPDGLPEKKVHLVDMSSLSFLLRSWAVT